MSPEKAQAYKEFMYGFISENKIQLFEHIVQHRTRMMTVVLEDLFQPHNASAVLRSCDCFGVQDVHIIENNFSFEIKPDIVLGSSKWLSIHRYYKKEHNTADALQKLKKQGYTIIGTTPHENDTNLEEFDIQGPTAFVFGTEKSGLSPVAMEHCDGFMKVPMYGFTESLNISVCAAIVIHHMKHKLMQSDLEWRLTSHEKDILLGSWAAKVTRRAALLSEEFEKRFGQNF